jgi:hypothetical protein
VALETRGTLDRLIRRLEFDLGIDKCERLIKTAVLKGFEGCPHDLHVLLRHRPHRISRRWIRQSASGSRSSTPLVSIAC